MVNWILVVVTFAIATTIAKFAGYPLVNMVIIGATITVSVQYALRLINRGESDD